MATAATATNGGRSAGMAMLLTRTYSRTEPSARRIAAAMSITAPAGMNTPSARTEPDTGLPSPGHNTGATNCSATANATLATSAMSTKAMMVDRIRRGSSSRTRGNR